MTPQQFYSQYLPYAEAVSNRTGLDPRFVLAQAALETGYGKSAPGMNFFGIKSHGRDGGQVLQTSEFEGGQMVRQPASFRAYESPEQSFQDYADFLQSNPRYEGVLSARGLEGQIAEMAKSGYATDPQYGAKLANTASQFDPNAAPIIAADAMRAIGRQPRGILAPQATAQTETENMIPQDKPRGLLGSLGIQKMEEGAEGETGQRFYQRDTFKDTAATLAQGFAALGGNQAVQKFASDVAGQRTEAKARNKTAEYLDKYMPGAGDLMREGFLTAKDAIALSTDRQSRQLAAKAGEAYRNGNIQEAMAILTQISPTAMGQQIAAQSKPRQSEVLGGGRYTVTYPDGPGGKPSIALNDEVIAAEQRIAAAEKERAPLPADARKAEESDFQAIEAHDNIVEDISGIIEDFGYDPETGEFNGPLQIGPAGAITGTLGVMGLGSENKDTALARQEFDRFKTRLINESLRLNTGVQTEGDAQRVAAELGDARNNASAYAAIQELLRINERARANKVAAIDRRRARFGVGGTETPEAPETPNLGWRIIP